MSRMRHSIISALICLVVAGVSLGYAQDEELPRPLTDAGSGAGANDRFITIDFDNVDIQLFIKYISELTGRNFVVDKVVQGNVTIISPTKISVADAYKVFQSVLEVHGFTTVDAGSVTKILPSARARSQNVEMVHVGAAPPPPEDKVVTQLVQLKFTSPEEIQKVLTPLVSQTAVMISHTPSGMLIITETLSNIQKLLRIIETLDVESREDEVAVIPLQFASAASLAKILGTIYQGSVAAAGRRPAEAARLRDNIQIVPYERANALIVLANASDMRRVRNLIAVLDTEVQRMEGNIHVYYLQNATAVEMAKVLNVLPERQPQGEEAAAARPAAISRNVQVMADEETNSLIVIASREEYLVLEEVIRKLDIPRRMVYLEALIMEVDADKTLDIGVEWAGAGQFSDETGILATGFSGPEGFNLIQGLDPEDPELPPGYSFGVLKQGIRIGDVVFPNIAAVLRAVKTDSDVNIIATPQILTTDNKKAEISVGENLPFITSQNTTASEQDYTQYEYRDVATKLEITPHINQSNTLRLEIYTEVVRLQADSEQNTPSTFKRTANTTVILNDNDTVVIGGIIGQDATEGEWKIPLLGDIPVLGWLFKTHSSTDRRTNMFIFITPRIIRNPTDALSVTVEKDVEMDKLRAGTPMKEQETRDRKINSMMLTERGYERLQAGDLESAKRLFRRALELDSANPYAAMDMGVVYEKEGENQLAIEMYQSVIASGTEAVANVSSDPDRTGIPLVQIARENIERLMKNEAGR